MKTAKKAVRATGKKRQGSELNMMILLCVTAVLLCGFVLAIFFGIYGIGIAGSRADAEAAKAKNYVPVPMSETYKVADYILYAQRMVRTNPIDAPQKMRQIIREFIDRNSAYLSRRDFDRLHDCASIKVYEDMQNDGMDALYTDELGKCLVEFKESPDAKYANADYLIGGIMPFDGSFLFANQLIRKHMKEPGSFEHIETTYTLNLDDSMPFDFYGKPVEKRSGKDFMPFVVIETSFSAKNVFGAKVKNTATITMELNDAPKINLVGIK
jgi:hypothetical protein